jgi:hypothetical protein
MQVWEYQVVSLVGIEHIENHLPPLGAEGWELVAAVGHLHYFKRPQSFPAQVGERAEQ